MLTLRRTAKITVAVMVFLLTTGRPAPAEEMSASATGQVFVNDEPLASGRIFFFLDDDQFVGSKLKAGAYKVARIPVGVWRVVIEGEGVPASFASEKTSPLTVEVRQAKNTLDFRLKRP